MVQTGLHNKVVLITGANHGIGAAVLINYLRLAPMRRYEGGEEKLDVYEPELEEQIIVETPLGWVGQPEDVADVIVFLASEKGRWVSGQMISVSGGRRMF